MKRPARVADLLPKYLERSGLAERVGQAGVLAEWPRLVGERIAAVAQADEIRRDGTLVVKVRTAPWAQELSLMTPTIIARINAGRSVGRVNAIHWTVGR